MSGDFTYFPYLRTGLASAVATPDDPSAAGHVQLTAVARVSGTVAQGVPLWLAGPGEIRGLDARSIARTDPAPDAIGVPPHLFATVEIHPADLPWMFTPLGATGDRLRPWMCLIVTEFEAGEPLVDASRPLPMLKVERPFEALPDPSEAWAWAHVAVAGDTDAAGLETAVTAQSESVVARLMCPRQLRPEKRYVASIVPLFEGGRKAGLGETINDADRLKPAWSVAANAPAVDLPVYHSWQFMTGIGGDFRSLALRLQGRSLPAGAGSRPMDVTKPGGGLPNLPSTAVTKQLGLEGALKPDGFVPSAWDGAEKSTFGTRIGNLIDRANTAAAALGPPLWGRWQAAQPTLPSATPAWLRELNRDPRHRAAAGLGARVIHEQREQLMTQAWKQVGEVERANQRLRQAQLARAQSKSLHLNALPAMSDGTFLQLTRPLHDRVVVAKAGRGLSTAGSEVRESSLPERLLDGAFRRVARPRGPLGRRLGRNNRDPGELVEKAAGNVISATPQVKPPGGAATIEAAVGRLNPAELQARPGVSGFTPLTDWHKEPPGARDSGPDSSLMHDFRDVVVQYEAWRAGLKTTTDAPPPLDVAGLRRRIMAGTDPDLTVPRRTRSVVQAPNWHDAHDPLEPIMVAPSFPQPMSVPLTAISQELMLPGLGEIPPETVTAAVPNAKFIEAYMVGLNHELSRELLFREYPTDQRGTYFRQFWDVRGRVPAPAPGTTDDIGPIDQWPGGNELGGDLEGAGAGYFVVIVRGELLRRYPDAAVYAAPARWTSPPPPPEDEVAHRELDPAGVPKFPEFRGRLEPDLTYFGFSELTADEAGGIQTPTSPTDEPGWFIVFEQHSTQPHYGLDDSTRSGPPPSADQITWDDVVPPPPAGQADRPFASAQRPAWPAWNTRPDWGTDSAALAAICLQRPTRLALHASDLLQP
jgi:hypothetical protein